MLKFLHKILHEMHVSHFMSVEILSEIHKMANAMTELKNAVEEQTTVIDSVTTLIQTMAQQIRDAADDPDEIQKLANQLEQNTQRLSAATVSNTDSDETDTPAEPPVDEPPADETAG